MSSGRVQNAQPPGVKAAFGPLLWSGCAPQFLTHAKTRRGGDAKEASDLDLLVVEDSVPNIAEEYGRLRGAIGSVGTGVDLLIYPLNELERRRNWQTSPVFDAVRGGKVMYERRA